MRSKLWILLYLLVLILIVFFEFQTTQKSSKLNEHRRYAIEENMALNRHIDEYGARVEQNISMRKLWGIKPKKVEKPKEEKKVDENVTKAVAVTLKKKILCIEKNCFRLLGIFVDKEVYATFYNKEKKIKVETFKVNDILDLSIKIGKIEKNSILFSDINSTREWNIKLFDINSSKYKPKEFE